MAHYLHRRFKEDSEVHVLHGLRLEDRAQPEQDGSPGVCQIDHLIVHRWGMFIVESKSVTQEVRVRPDGSGGGEWTRVHRRDEKGMPSPIEQARRQSEFLRTFLQRHRQELLGIQPFGLRSLAKVKHGTDQRGFMQAPIQLIIAVSDEGIIRRLDGWEEPRKPFSVFVTKADLVPDKIDRELKRHRKGGKMLSIHATGEYGLWSMEAAEAGSVAEFLCARHAEPSQGPAAQPGRVHDRRSPNRSRLRPDGAKPVPDAVCRHCGATEISARWGKYGYHWRCGECGGNTQIPVECSACGAKRQRHNHVVKIRKKGPNYFRECKECQTSEIVWTEA